MKTTLAVALLLSAFCGWHLQLAQGAPAFTQEHYDSFTNFKKTYSKKYDSYEEEFYRFGVFASNYDLVEDHNRRAALGLHSYELGINRFADLSGTEFKTLYLSAYNRTRPYNYVTLETLETPDSVDWRAQGAVTPVKNQGSCGACWSFSTTGAVEGAHAIATGQLVSLSEQQLIDCSTSEGNSGCNGGLMDYAFEYVISNGGLDTEEDYPYTAADGTCNAAKANKHVASISSYADVPSNSESQLLAAVSKQPVSVAIEADQSAFQLYKSGVFDAKCGTNLDHGVLVVGYGTSTADYWIVKNSWGPDWGEEGFIYMARGVGTKGICGIAMDPSYPVV